MSVEAWFQAMMAGGGIVYDTDYQAYLTYLSGNAITPPDDAVKVLQNQLVLDLKAGGVWDERSSLLYIFSNGSKQEAAKVNIRNPGTNTLTEQGTLVFDSQGFASNGSTGYLQTGWNPSSDAAFLQNDAGISCWLDDNVSGTGMAFGVSDGSNQLLYQPRNASNAIQCQINDFTNDGLSTCTNSRGFFTLNRTSSTVKRLSKAGTANNAATRTSTGRPNRNLTLLARDNNGTVSGFFTGHMSYFSAGGGLNSTALRAAEYRAFFRYYQRLRALNFVVTDEPFEAAMIGLGGGGAWDATSVYAGGIPTNNIMYYNGLDTVGAPGDTREFEVGAFDLSTATSGSKNAGNPILTRSALSITGSSEGIMIFSHWDNSDDRYYFAARSQSDGTRDIVMLKGTVSSPHSITAIMYDVITAGDFNHSPFIMEHPTDATKLLLFYSARTNSGDPLKVRVADILKSDVIGLTPSSSVTILNSDIVTAQAGSTSMVYPCVEYSGGTYTMFYSEGYSNCGTATFENRFSQSSDFTSFTTSYQLDAPFGDDGYDGGYKAVPRVSGNYIYHSGRTVSGSSAPYTGVGVKSLIRN